MWQANRKWIKGKETVIKQRLTETEGKQDRLLYFHLKDFTSFIEWSRAMHACRCFFFPFQSSYVRLLILDFFIFLFQSLFGFHRLSLQLQFPRLSNVMNDFWVNGKNYFWCYFCDTVDYVENLLLCNCRQYLEFFFVIANRGCSWEMVCCVSLAWIIHDSIPFI